MSTSDAGELELRVVGGETATPLFWTAGAARTTTAREERVETSAERFKQENHCGDETPTGQQCRPSAIRQEETHQALILRADRLRQEEAARCGDSKVQTLKPIDRRFTSRLVFRLKKNLDPCLQSSTETQRAETENSRCQVHGLTSPSDTFINVASDCTLSERISAKKKEELATAVCNELEITRDLTANHSFSNGEFGLHERKGVCIPYGSQPRTDNGENIKDHTKLERHTDLVELPNSTRTMLSSSVVTVLAPHWSGRLRRTKRFEGTGNLEAQGGLQDVTNTAANHTHERFQETVDRSLTHGSQAQLRVPFLVTRRNTVGCSTKSGLASLDYEPERKMTQTVSLDVNSGRMDNRQTDAGALSTVATTLSPVSPLSLDPNEQRRNLPTGHQGGLSSLSSKPTTSSLLLSLRRVNSNGRNSNAASTLSEIKPLPLCNSPSDRDGKLFPTHLSQTLDNSNVQERSKPLVSQLTISHRTTETGPILSPSSSNHKERTMFETRFISASPTDREAEDAHFTQQPQTTNRTQSSLSCSKQAFLSRGQSERQLNCRGSDKGTNLFSKTSVCSPRHSPYDHSALPKTHSFPRRTTLTSTSWWKQVTQEGGSPLMGNDTMNIRDKPNIPLVPRYNGKSDLASSSLNDSKRFSNQILNNKENGNISESVHKGNMNIVMKTQGVSQNFKQRNAEDSPDQESDSLGKPQYGFNLKVTEPPKPHSLPDAFSGSKISRATMETALSHPKDLTKHDVSNDLFTANATELPPTLLNPKSSDTPTESSSKYSNNHHTSKTNSTTESPHNKDSQKFTKPSVLLITTNTLNSQAFKTASGLPLTPNSKTSSSFHSHPFASQTNIHASSYTGSSSQIAKFTNTANITPMGFERSYASIPKPFNPKTVSNLIPTVSTFSKTNYSSVSTTPTISSSTTGSHPAVTTAPSPSLLTPPVTPVLASSPATITVSSLLTPPATPVITSPNCSDTSNPKEGKILSSNQERDVKKLHPNIEGKRVRRVTWEDSVDLQHSEPITVEMSEPSQVPTRSPSPSRSLQSINAPSIFSFQRSSSPTTNTSLSSPITMTSSIQVVKGGKYRSLSSDSADLVSREQERSKQRPSDTVISDQRRQTLTTPRQERTLSVESGTVQRHSFAPPSLPSEFPSGYKLRYSSTPYSTLMSTRSTQGETKTITPRSPLFQQPSQSNFTPHLCVRAGPGAVMTLTSSKPPLSPVSLPQPPSLPFQKNTVIQESSKCGVSETDKLKNNNGKNNSQDRQKSRVLLVNNRVHVNSQSLQSDETHSSSSTFVTETLVYSVKSNASTAPAAPKNTTPKPPQPVSVETKLNQQSHTMERKKAAGEPCSHSDQSSSGSSSTESQPPDDEGSNRRMNVLGKSKFLSVESNNEKSPKRSRFALKKSVSTPNSSLSRSDSDKANKTNNKMDQVLNKLRQTFSTRRSDDDMLFPWKWKRASQTPSVSGSSDISNVGDITVESTKTVERQEQEKRGVLKDNEKGTELTNRWTQNRYTLTPPSASGCTVAGDNFYIWSDKSTPETDQDEQNAGAEHMSESKSQPPLTIHSPTMHQFDFYKDNRTNYKSTNQFHSCRDPSPGRSPNPSTACPTQFGKSSSSPRSPFSPFSSLSPLSSFPSPEVTDDSVFYSPKLQRRRESSSPCEPGEGISLGGSRRSRASTGPPSASPEQDKECLASSYADLKYGIEPGRSFSVSSVLSSRPSGPGRISTGSRFMSVGDLSASALTCGSTGKDLDHWSVTSDWTSDYDCLSSKECRMSFFPSDPGKMKSRSLPRSLTRRLANWSSGVPASPPVNTTASKPAKHWSPNMNICHFAWDTEGPPTPPPTPPLSPVSRRMSKPPSLSSPTCPSSPGAPQQVDSQSSRRHLPSRGYVSSLSTFEESTDSSSDTTTDDEYYLETGEDEEKETEL